MKIRSICGYYIHGIKMQIKTYYINILYAVGWQGYDTDDGHDENPKKKKPELSQV